MPIYALCVLLMCLIPAFAMGQVHRYSHWFRSIRLGGLSVSG